MTEITAKAKARISTYFGVMGIDDSMKAQVILAAIQPAALDIVKLVSECNARIVKQDLDDQECFTQLRQTLIGIQALREILDEILGVRRFTNAAD